MNSPDAFDQLALKLDQLIEYNRKLADVIQMKFDLRLHPTTREELTTAEAAQQLGCTGPTVTRYINSGRLEAFKAPDGTWRVKQTALDKFKNGDGASTTETDQLIGRRAAQILTMHRTARLK